MSKKRTDGQQGFTLIELLIVIAILGILAAVAIPRYFGAVTEGQKNACISTQRTIKSSLEVYRIRDGVYPSDIAASDTYFAGSTFAQNPDYFEDEPYCPAAPTANQNTDNSYNYDLGTDGNTYALSCKINAEHK